MKYFTYGRLYNGYDLIHPCGLLPMNTTSSVFYNSNWFGASEIDDLSIISLFDPSEISKEYFDDAYAHWKGGQSGSL
jgi:hypothetical protein